MYFKQSKEFNNNVSCKLNFSGYNIKTTKYRKYSTSLWVSYSQITMNSFWWGMYICLASPICELPVGKAVHQGCQTASVSSLTKCTTTFTSLKSCLHAVLGSHHTVRVIAFSLRWGSHISPHEDSSLLGWRRVDWQIFSDRGAYCLQLQGLRSRDCPWTENSENGGSKLTRGFSNGVLSQKTCILQTANVITETHVTELGGEKPTRVETLIVTTIYLQLIQNTYRYMFRSFTVLQCSHQHCVQPVASDVEVVGYL